MTTNYPKAEERARELLKPHEFRVGQRRDDLGGVRIESSVVDYWKAVHVVADLLTKLDEAERERAAWQASARDGWEARARSAEERERILIAGVREAIHQLDEAGDVNWDEDNYAAGTQSVAALLSLLLPHTLAKGGKNDE